MVHRALAPLPIGSSDRCVERFDCIMGKKCVMWMKVGGWQWTSETNRSSVISHTLFGNGLGLTKHFTSQQCTHRGNGTFQLFQPSPHLITWPKTLNILLYPLLALVRLCYVNTQQLLFIPTGIQAPERQLFVDLIVIMFCG